MKNDPLCQTHFPTTMALIYIEYRHVMNRAQA